MDDAMRSAMGFAMRAGKCVAGGLACEKAVKGGKAQLFLLDAAASENTTKRYRALCEHAGIPCISIKDMGAAIGKYGRMAAVITDPGFARRIADLSESSQGD